MSSQVKRKIKKKLLNSTTYYSSLFKPTLFALRVHATHINSVIHKT